MFASRLKSNVVFISVGIGVRVPLVPRWVWIETTKIRLMSSQGDVVRPIAR